MDGMMHKIKEQAKSIMGIILGRYNPSHESTAQSPNRDRTHSHPSSTWYVSTVRAAHRAPSPFLFEFNPEPLRPPLPSPLHLYLSLSAREPPGISPSSSLSRPRQDRAKFASLQPVVHVAAAHRRFSYLSPSSLVFSSLPLTAWANTIFFFCLGSHTGWQRRPFRRITVVALSSYWKPACRLRRAKRAAARLPTIPRVPSAATRPWDPPGHRARLHPGAALVLVRHDDCKVICAPSAAERSIGALPPHRPPT
jgi:hypothetical protein